MKDESRIEETSYVKARAKRHPSPLIAILTIHILSFHIGVKLLRPKILLSPMAAGPFNGVKPLGGGRGRGKRGGEGSPQPGEGKPAGKEER